MVKCGLLKLKLYIDLLTGAIKSLNIPLLGVNLTPLQDNAWLSGLIDADGSFYLNWLYDKSKLPTSLQYYLRISQRKTSHSNNLTNFIFMNNIANLVDINLWSYERKRFNYIILLPLNKLNKLNKFLFIESIKFQVQ